MRLTQQQADCIRNALHHHFGLKAEVWLFGSRVDDRARC
ncbi:MAG: DNA polymerase III subunit beta, partial [Deltaproteobacteria bacterium]|nr:DNA polymerase III subunit beta [Deltaproteobacteria bacterium]